MNLGPEKAKLLVAEMLEGFDAAASLTQEVILAVPFIDIAAVKPLIEGHSKFALAAQNLHQAESGAFTGEISAAMLVEAGCKYVLVGHSERREYFAEGNALLLEKAQRALAHGLHPIFCIGETLSQREADATFSVLEQQLDEGLFHLSQADCSKVVIAYEPVWAIGTGKTATPDEAQAVHAWIRLKIYHKYGEHTANSTSILYGGSVNPANATLLFACNDIDGGLVGGASLKAPDFLTICDSFIS